MRENEKITIGVSSCLLGENVRYDGANKLSKTTLAFGVNFNCVSLCPEVAIGLGVPRAIIKLFSHANSTRALLSEHPFEDVSQKLRQYAQEIAARSTLYGYITKSGSPSCGPQDIPTFDCNGNPINTSNGIFIDQLCAEIKDLPLIDEKQLEIPDERERFLKKVTEYYYLNSDNSKA